MTVKIREDSMQSVERLRNGCEIGRAEKYFLKLFAENNLLSDYFL